MLTRTDLSIQEALACTMVLVAAADGGMTDREIGAMTALVQTLPVFQTFTIAELREASDAAVHLLEEADGIAHAGRLIRAVLSPQLRETAYAIACDVAAASRLHSDRTMNMLELIASELHLDPLIAAALERGARARQFRQEG